MAVRMHGCVCVCVCVCVCLQSPALEVERTQELEDVALGGVTWRGMVRQSILLGRWGGVSGDRRGRESQGRMKGLGRLLGLPGLRAFCLQAALVPQIPLKEKKPFPCRHWGKAYQSPARGGE